MSAEQLLPQLLGPFGLLVGALVLIVALQKEWLVPGGAFRRQVRETEYWKRVAVTNSSLAKGFQRLAEERSERNGEAGGMGREALMP